MYRRDYIEQIGNSGKGPDGLNKMRIADLKELYSQLKLDNSAQDFQDVSNDPMDLNELTSDYSDSEEEVADVKEEVKEEKDMGVTEEKDDHVIPVQIPDDQTSETEDDGDVRDVIQEPVEVKKDRLVKKKPQRKIDIKVFEKECLERVNIHKQSVRDLLKEFSGKLDETDKDYLREDYNSERDSVEKEIEAITKLLSGFDTSFTETFMKRVNKSLDREMNRVRKKLE